jgi:branched-chain amino acid transport system permease protein
MRILLGTMIQVSFALEALGLFAIAAVIFGGIESLVGAIVGGIIIGLIEQFSEGYIGDYIPAIKTVAPFVVLLLVLMFRPHGLFGQKSIERI